MYKIRVWLKTKQKQTTRLKRGQRILTDIFPKKTHEWPAGAQRDAHRHWPRADGNQSRGQTSPDACQQGRFSRRQDVSAGEGVEKSGASRIADGNAHRSGHGGKRRGASSKHRKQSSPGTRQSRRGSSLNEKENTNSRRYTAPCSQQPRPHSTEKGGGHPAVCGSAVDPKGGGLSETSPTEKGKPRAISLPRRILQHKQTKPPSSSSWMERK